MPGYARLLLNTGIVIIAGHGGLALVWISRPVIHVLGDNDSTGQQDALITVLIRCFLKWRNESGFQRESEVPFPLAGLNPRQFQGALSI